MKMHALKNLRLVINAVCLTLLVSAAQAAPLITFSNGEVADADEVNANFTELETRINNISLTPGPQGPVGPQGIPGQNGSNGLNGLDGATGPQGPVGPQGPQGNTGMTGPTGPAGPIGPQGPAGPGVVTYPWLGFGSAAWDAKAFVVTPAEFYDKEVRTYSRTPNGDGTGTTEVTRQRTLSGTPYSHQIFTYEWDNTGEFTQTKIETFSADGSTLGITETFTPGLIIRHSAMGMGMTWGTSSQVDIVYADGMTPNDVDFEVNGYSLVAIENITVKGVAYTGCQKILKHRATSGVDLSWHCPGAGLVKKVLPGRMLEFDPNDQLSVPSQTP